MNEEVLGLSLANTDYQKSQQGQQQRPVEWRQTTIERIYNTSFR